MISGDAFFFDGSGARRRPVKLALGADGISIGEGGREIAFWRYADLELADAPKDVMRLTAAGAADLARLDVRDLGLKQAIGARSPPLAERRRRGEAGAGRIVLWSMAAAVSLVLTVVFLVPPLADRLAPLVPIAVERRLGEAVDSQVRALFGAETCEAEPGRAALARLGERLTQAADLPMPAEISVLRSEIPNAVALPGGRVYVFGGLLDLARSPDELAGVIAHELGHVAGRDGLRKLLETGGSSYLLGLLFGDVTGGGALVFAVQVLVDTRYSRAAERAADRVAADLMLDIGRSPEPLGERLGRLGGATGEGLAFISSHPVTAERMRELAERQTEPTGDPILSNLEWQALKRICKASP
jgi:predicted Zn-dependent protease